jgi:deoxyribodipyrimidine photolyase-related protein
MSEFYKQQRRRMNLLLDDGQPAGGRWSFDADNRKKLPRNIILPEMPSPAHTQHVKDVITIVEREFSDHPGKAAEFCWPTTRSEAEAWLDDFIANRLEQFGPYEDAMTTRSPTVFHSVLSPCLNLGLLTPDDVIDRVISQADEVPLQSLEGFVRGIYRTFSERQESSNFWVHERELTDAWYKGTTGIPPLDDKIRTAQRLGWTHHIPQKPHKNRGQKTGVRTQFPLI